MPHPQWRSLRQDAGRPGGPPAWANVALFAFRSAIGERTGARPIEDTDFPRGETEPPDAPFALATVIEEAAAEAVMHAEAKGLWLALGGDLDPSVRVIGDERGLREVLRTILSNAVKFTDQGGVELQASLAEHGLEIEIADTGCGLADATLARLFEGAGMGLTLARRLVDGMDGAISARNRPGGGAVFTLGLPFERAEPAPVAAAVEGPAPRVLVVDDHPVNREVAKLLLQALGCQTTMAGDGLEAVKAVKALRYDLILMDVRMPKLDGLAAARRIRALKGAAGKTPIVAVTAYAMPEDLAKTAEAGMDGHLAKPITSALLAEALARHLGGQADEPRRSAA
jgi:CheY-like chemotaxis protein